MTTCEACGSPLPPEAEFCPVCAAPVPPRPAGGETPAAGPGGAGPGAGGEGSAATHGDGPAHLVTTARTAVATATPQAPGTVPPVVEGGPEWASAGRRLGAFVIDQAVVSAPVGVIALVALARLGDSPGPEELIRVQLLSLLGLVGWAVLWVLEARTGRTVGNFALGIRTVHEQSLEPAGLGKIFVRYLVQGLGALACFVGVYVVVLSPLWDNGSRRQGWQDKAVGTVVVRTRRGAGSGRDTVGPGRDTAFPTTPPAPPAAAPTAPAPTATAASTPMPSAPAEPIIAAVPGFSRPAAPPVEPPSADVPSPGAPAPTSGGSTSGAVNPEGLAPAPAPEPALPAEPAGEAALAAEPEADPGALAEPEADPGAPAEPSGVPARPAEPGAAAESDVDRTRLAAPAERGDVVLILPGGERLTITGDGVLGRNPAVPVGEAATHFVAVADPTRSVSKTHLGFGLDTVGLWVKDLHSTNGTAVVSPDGNRTLLTPGLAVHVMPGDVVVVGDVEVEVTR